MCDVSDSKRHDQRRPRQAFWYTHTARYGVCSPFRQPWTQVTALIQHLLEMINAQERDATAPCWYVCLGLSLRHRSGQLWPKLCGVGMLAP